MPTDTSAITFKETGKTAVGIFAAFYRVLGAAITGLPLSDQYKDASTGLITQDWQRLVMEEYPTGTVRLRMIGEEWRALNSRVRMLERQIAWLRSGATGPQQPEIVDVSARLARKPEEMLKRTLADIQYVIVNHTAVRPVIGADLVAKAQVARWPGIISQYYITEDGKVQRTNADDEVVSQDIGWIFNGLNIYVAGNFDDAVPNDAQMDALAQLCAWLLTRYDLPETALRGVSEFIVTHSPGLQWLTGKRWKDDLLSKVELLLAPPEEPAEPRAVIDFSANTARVADLETQVRDLGGRLVEVQNRSTLLQSQLHHLLRSPTATDGAVAKPIFSDIVPQLPREVERLKIRPTAQINHLLLHHTRVDAAVPAESIAERHVKQWGGILYHFMIGADGSIVQTGELDRVIDLDQAWTARGINIALSGDFTTDVPKPRQIDATARLCAWLMQEHKIPAENVKGISEFVPTDSPGKQWAEDKCWKEQLAAAISSVQNAAQSTESDDTLVTALRAHMAELEEQLATTQDELTQLTSERDHLLEQVSAPSEAELSLREQVQSLTSQIQNLSGQVQTLTQDKATLTQQIESIRVERQGLQAQNQTLTQAKADLTRQLATAAQERSTLLQRVDDLLAQIKTLQGQESETVPSAPPSVPAPAIVDIVDKLPKHETLRYETRALEKITQIAVHHSAGPANVSPESIAAYHVRKDWPGMGYHFYVEPDGSIYQTNRLETISYQVYKHNETSVGVCVAGIFNDAIPTPRQIAQTGQLVAWLMQELHVPIDRVWGHREFPDNATACPGNDWLSGQKWKDLLLARIRTVQAGQIGPTSLPIRHYMLFWQHNGTWAHEDWDAAVNYVAHFAPTCGFSVDEAKNAEYVTIVGGVSGVSFESEQALVSAGCHVERLAGKDYADTKRMLDSLADSGRRFMTFNT